jgi:hypothetical protein
MVFPDSTLFSEEPLKIALWIAEGIGFTDGNRHPLYSLLLAPLASRDISFFTTAKLFSMFLGSAGLGIIFVVSRRVVGGIGALAVLILMVWNGEFQRTAVLVHAEVLLVPLFFLAWYTAVKALTASPPKAPIWSFLAGLSAGLVYVAKANGTLLGLVYGLTLLCLMGLGLFRSPRLWLFGIAFSLVAFPLWLYNMAQFGNPLFNINTTNYMWLDSWEESYVYAAADLPTFSTYWRDHTVEQVIERVRNGLVLSAPTGPNGRT